MAFTDQEYFDVIEKNETVKEAFTDQEYFEVIEKNETVKEAFKNIKQICVDLQKKTDCPQEDLESFLEFISRQLNK